MLIVKWYLFVRESKKTCSNKNLWYTNVCFQKNLLPPNLSPVKSPHCSFCSTHTPHLHKTKSDEEIFDVWCMIYEIIKSRQNWLLWNLLSDVKASLNPSIMLVDFVLTYDTLPINVNLSETNVTVSSVNFDSWK